MGVLRVKAGVEFARIDPAGFRILAACDDVVRHLPHDLTITCGTDSHSSGSHPKGRAYDLRLKDVPSGDRAALASAIMAVLVDEHHYPGDAITRLDELEDNVDISYALATTKFFAQIEFPNSAKVHLHIQQRVGKVFP